RSGTQSSDGLSTKVGTVADPKPPIKVKQTATPTDSHSITPAQFFTVIASGAAYLDVKARLREGTAPARPPVSDYPVIIDAVSTGGDANLLLRGSVKETTPGYVKPGVGTVTTDGCVTR